jgi:hypothetical protein
MAKSGPGLIAPISEINAIDNTLEISMENSLL